MSESALIVAGMHKRFGAVRVLEGADLHARGGEVHAVLGENGAGKSTLMKILAGVIAADAGQVTLDGRPVSLDRPAAATSAGIRTVFQELSTIPQLTVAENLLYGREETRLGLVRRGRRREAARGAPALLAALARVKFRELPPASGTARRTRHPSLRPRRPRRRVRART